MNIHTHTYKQISFHFTISPSTLIMFKGVIDSGDSLPLLPCPQGELVRTLDENRRPIRVLIFDMTCRASLQRHDLVRLKHSEHDSGRIVICSLPSRAVTRSKVIFSVSSLMYYTMSLTLYRAVIFGA